MGNEVTSAEYQIVLCLLSWGGSGWGKRRRANGGCGGTGGNRGGKSALDDRNRDCDYDRDCN